MNIRKDFLNFQKFLMNNLLKDLFSSKKSLSYSQNYELINEIKKMFFHIKKNKNKKEFGISKKYFLY
jgi:hypothetical protein